MSDAPPPPLRLLSGHSDSVICLSPSDHDGDGNILASGGEDGWLVLHDLRAPAPAAVVASGAALGAARNPVAAVAFCPSGRDVLYAAAGASVVALDLRAFQAAPSSAAAATTGPAPWNPLASSSPADAARDDVSALCATAEGGGLLASADDAGDVAVFDLLRVGAGGAVAAPSIPQQHLKRRVLLRSAHGDSPACAVAFSPPPLAGGAGAGAGAGGRRPPQTVTVLSGGCDSRVALSDTGLPFSVATSGSGGSGAGSGGGGGGGGSSGSKRRPPRSGVSVWQMGGEAMSAGGAVADADGNDGGVARVAAETAGGPRVCNPPFVMGLSTAAAVDGRGGETAVAAVARGDGVLAVFEPFAEGGGGSEGPARRGSGCPTVFLDAHKRAASCARFVRLGRRAPDGERLMLCSGGDDGRVNLWFFGPFGRSAGGGPPPCPLASPPQLFWETHVPKRGRAKVNAAVDVCGAGGFVLAVADTGRTVKVYDPMGG